MGTYADPAVVLAAIQNPGTYFPPEYIDQALLDVTLTGVSALDLMVRRNVEISIHVPYPFAEADRQFHVALQNRARQPFQVVAFLPLFGTVLPRRTVVCGIDYEAYMFGAGFRLESIPQAVLWAVSTDIITIEDSIRITADSRRWALRNSLENLNG